MPKSIADVLSSDIQFLNILLSITLLITLLSSLDKSKVLLEKLLNNEFVIIKCSKSAFILIAVLPLLKQQVSNTIYLNLFVFTFPSILTKVVPSEPLNSTFLNNTFSQEPKDNKDIVILSETSIVKSSTVI